MILGAALVCAGIYAFAHHTFERHYVALFILGPPLLLSFSAVVVSKSKQGLTPPTPRSGV
jgi:hypothetical protein